jgi:RimJ/RimL family protein N-acetyltransferase
MDRIVINDPLHKDALAYQVGNPPVRISICRVSDNKLRGGIVYSDFHQGESIEMHVGGFDPFWLNRDLLFAAFGYPFLQLGVKRVFARMSEGNPRVLALTENVGFRRIARIEGVYRGGFAQIVARLDREDCRFLRIEPWKREA